MNSDATFWKGKLLAYLHDPPHKPVGIQYHEDQRGSFLNRFGLSEEDLREFKRRDDWQAAAADRLIFPDPSKSGLKVDWKESWMEFCHPLGGARLKAGAFPPTAAQLETELTRALEATRVTDREEWQRKFIVGWRLWPELAAREKNAHFAYLVADTRIPDHTLWHHNALAAAFTACEGQPAFLMFQIGPVQDFIAQSRKTQDLWSASYLLSFLIAQAMLAIADEIGPDAVIFPQLRGLPLADFHWWKRGYFGTGQKLRASHPNELLTPNLPNRFLALVPAARGQELAALAEHNMRKTWEEIARKVKTFLEKQLGGACPGWDKNWNAQVERFPVVDWVVHPWASTATAVEQAKQNSPPLSGGWENHPLHDALRWASEFIPKGERESYGPDSNSGFAWALHFAATDWKFAACKNARGFPPWQRHGPLETAGVPKDHLDGRNEVLGGVEPDAFWRKLRETCPRHFKGSQLYGALTVIKRLWPEEYLKDLLDLDQATPVFQPVNEIAQVDEAIDAEGEDAEKYYAVIAMDGDDMGQWVRGVIAAPLVNSLAEPAQVYFRKHWPVNVPSLPAADVVLRPLSPGYHAAFSEALANFSLYCARPIVEAFGGQLIYVGGDDVLAMLPARTALDCAHALQLAFRGLNPAAPPAHASVSVQQELNKLFDYSHHADGFLTLRKSNRGDVGRAGHLKPNWPLMVMGPCATASVGLAIGHVRSPMQDTIQSARDAEKAAKTLPGKGAFCLSILKRSGERAQFAASFQTGVAGVWAELRSGVLDQTGRFAYRYLQLIKQLLAASDRNSDGGWERHWTEDLKQSVAAELWHVLRQQANQEAKVAQSNASRWIGALIGEDLQQPVLAPRDFLHFWMAWAFVKRIS